MLLWGKYVALGKICYSGEAMLLWGKYVTLGKYVALGKICCSGENMLLWGGNVALGFLYSGENHVRICSGENMLWGEEENWKKGENFTNF